MEIILQPQDNEQNKKLDQTQTEYIEKKAQADALLEKTTFLSFMTVAEARAYAERLTAEAIDAIAPYEGNETLTELAKFLLHRNK